jgi:hypothetical protein
MAHPEKLPELSHERPSTEEGLMLITAFHAITDPGQRAEILALALKHANALKEATN